MIKSYKYIETNHSKLHEFIIDFFKRIEFETGEFDESFFDKKFLEIANRHPRLIKRRCHDIFLKIKNLNQTKRTKFVNGLKDSNKIEEICQGNITPLNCNTIPNEIREDVKILFIDLYKKILTPQNTYFSNIYGTMLEHFILFKTKNDNHLCPACGIIELHTKHDDTRDQYDHYLPKSTYPLSSVNFKNLVPICGECNSPNVKGSKDVLNIAKGKIIYPYDQKHSGIQLKVKVKKDKPKLDDIEWEFKFSTAGKITAEIVAWKSIFNIETRYESHIKGRIKDWYDAYMAAKQHCSTITPGIYITILKSRKDVGVDFVEAPSFEAFINETKIGKAELEAKKYS